MRVEDLHQARDGPAHGLSIARVEVGAEREVAVDDLGEVQLPQLPQRLREVVDDEPVVVGEVLVAHLRHFPPRQVEVQPVDERHVVADHVRQRGEQVPRLDHHVDRLVGVAEHRDAGVAGRRPHDLAGTSRLAVGLERRDDLRGIFWRSAISSNATTSQIITIPFSRPLMWPKRFATVVGPVSSAVYGDSS